MGIRTLKNTLKATLRIHLTYQKQPQNKIIQCCGETIKENLLQNIKKNEYYSVIADEALDTSNKEQMSLVLRFVDKNSDVREDFLGCLHCKSADLEKH